MKGYRIAVIENLGITEVLWVAFSPKNIARGRASERNVPDVSLAVRLVRRELRTDSTRSI
jgi:hypothetical protein